MLTRRCSQSSFLGCENLIVRGRNFLLRAPIPIFSPFRGAVPCPQAVRQVLGEDEVRRIAAVLHAAAVQEFPKFGDEVGRIPRTSRCWAIAARCVFDVVWHIGIWLVIQCALSAAMPELGVREKSSYCNRSLLCNLPVARFTPCDCRAAYFQAVSKLGLCESELLSYRGVFASLHYASRITSSSSDT